MEWLRRWGGRFRAADAALSWAERAYLVYMVGLSTIVSAVFGVITWILQNFVYGLLAFFGVWTLVTALQAFRVIKRPTSTGETEHEVEQVRDGSGVPGIPEHMIAERHIRYHENPIRLVDLLEVTGEGGVLRDFQFDHCILEGPGVINIEGPFPKPEAAAMTSGSGAHGSLSVGPTHCRVEGSPDTTLYQVTSGGKPPVGIIHLSGYTLRSVTFKGLGFAGTPEHLEWLKEQLIFSEGNNAPTPDSENEEHTQNRQEHRQRIDEWRSVIHDFDLDRQDERQRFLKTDTYHQMKRCGLKPEVIEIFEADRTFHVGKEVHGGAVYRYKLLDEVARIEEECGLI